MNDNDGLVDVHAHFTTDGYIDHAKATGHNGACSDTSS
jgi:hypothetical protein